MGRGHGKVGALIPTQKTSLMPPLVRAPRPLSGAESLRLQGFPGDLVAKLAMDQGVCESDTLMEDLAGNAFCGPVYISVLLFTVLHMPPRTALFCKQFGEARKKQKGAQQERTEHGDEAGDPTDFIISNRG